MFYLIEEVLDVLKKGEVIIVVDDEDRENEGDFVVFVEYVILEVINFMVIYGRGLICMLFSEEIVDKFDFYFMVEYNIDFYYIVFMVSIDYCKMKMGISV